ncbi:MAG: hypothetical protein ACI9SC_002369 [Gammaproteobacteria bacterium]|jgi:hypothetical protein
MLFLKPYFPKKNKRVLNKPEMSPPSRRADNSINPIFYISQDSDEYYFVNQSNETIPWLRVRSPGESFLAGLNPNVYKYNSIHPNEAVKVFEFKTEDKTERKYFIEEEFALSVQLVTDKYGFLEFVFSENCDSPGVVLLWSDNKVPRKVLLDESPDFTPESWD